MFKFVKKAASFVKTQTEKVCLKAKMAVLSLLVAFLNPCVSFAQTLAATGYEAGTSALDEVANALISYLPYIINLCYALAGIVAVGGAISVYIAMNNEEQDVKKKIMMVIGACIFLIAAARCLPLFFGIVL